MARQGYMSTTVSLEAIDALQKFRVAFALERHLTPLTLSDTILTACFMAEKALKDHKERSEVQEI